MWSLRRAQIFYLALSAFRFLINFSICEMRDLDFLGIIRVLLRRWRGPLPQPLRPRRRLGRRLGLLWRPEMRANSRDDGMMANGSPLLTAVIKAPVAGARRLEAVRKVGHAVIDVGPFLVVLCGGVLLFQTFNRYVHFTFDTLVSWILRRQQFLLVLEQRQGVLRTSDQPCVNLLWSMMVESQANPAQAHCYTTSVFLAPAGGEAQLLVGNPMSARSAQNPRGA